MSILLKPTPHRLYHKPNTIMEINIFSWLEVKHKIYWKHLQTVDTFFADMKLIPEGAFCEEPTDEDVITMADYEYLSEFLLSDKVKRLQPRVSRDYPKDDYEVLYEMLGTPHYNIHILVQTTPFERKLMPLPEGFFHPWKPSAKIVSMTPFDKSERLRKGMEKLNKNVGDSWWYNYNYWTGTLELPNGLLTTTGTRTNILKLNVAKKQDKGKTYNQQLRELYNVSLDIPKNIKNIWLVAEPIAPDIKPLAKYGWYKWREISTDSSSIVKIADL